jgi:hypothetical protein
MAFEISSREEIIRRREYRSNIKGDKFSLYISNYPSNAMYLRSRIGNPKMVLAELCCSIGITLEYLAPGFKRLICVDHDAKILNTCKTNLKESGVFHKTELILGDIYHDDVLKRIKADIVIYDIPYWYPHEQENEGDLVTKNPPLKDLIQKIKKYITPNIVIFSPPEWTFNYFESQLDFIEFEQVFINQKHNRNQVYLGDLILQKGITKISLNH